MYFSLFQIPYKLDIRKLNYFRAFLSVVQLKLAMPDLACKNSQNARKIARLCLSYSNRWIDTFQYTHEICVADIKYELRSKNAKNLTPAQLALVTELSEALFDPYSDAQQQGQGQGAGH